MNRDTLFKSMGFKCIGGMIEGFFDSNPEIEYDTTIWIDFKRERVILDSGDGSEPFFLKGDWLSEEEELFRTYDGKIEKEIVEYAENFNKQDN